MLSFAIFILLPAVALAGCNKTTLRIFFKALDKNHDEKVEKAECYDCFHAVDTDHNYKLTEEEFAAGVPFVEPQLQGYEREIIDFQDTNKDGVITPCDIETDFDRVDTNKDGYKSKEEFERHLRKRCCSACSIFDKY